MIWIVWALKKIMDHLWNNLRSIPWKRGTWAGRPRHPPSPSWGRWPRWRPWRRSGCWGRGRTCWYCSCDSWRGWGTRTFKLSGRDSSPENASSNSADGYVVGFGQKDTTHAQMRILRSWQSSFKEDLCILYRFFGFFSVANLWEIRHCWIIYQTSLYCYEVASASIFAIQSFRLRLD